MPQNLRKDTLPKHKSDPFKYMSLFLQTLSSFLWHLFFVTLSRCSVWLHWTGDSDFTPLAKLSHVQIFKVWVMSAPGRLGKLGTYMQTSHWVFLSLNIYFEVKSSQAKSISSSIKMMEPKRHLQISYLRFRINILPLSKNSENIILHCDHPLTQHNAAARNESSLQNTLYFFPPLPPSAKWLFVHERHRASETD